MSIQRMVLIFAVLLALSGITSTVSYAKEEKKKDDQANCKVRFAAYQMNPRTPGGTALGLSKEQGKWYKENKKKYPTVCFVTENPDYVGMWSSKSSTDGGPSPTFNYGAIASQAGNTQFGGYEYSIGSSYENENVYRSIFRAEDMEWAQQDRFFQPMPVFSTQHDSWWTYRKSHHETIKEAVKFLEQSARE